MTVVSADRISQPLWARLAELAATATGYFVLARGSLLFASLNASATPVWAPTGLAIALILVRGNALLPAIFVGAFAANFQITPSLSTAGLIAIGNSLEAYIACIMLRRWADGERLFYSPLGLAKFAVVVVGVAAPVSASIGVTTLAATGFAPWRDFATVWATWWLGDLAGAILVTPAFVFWARTLRGEERRTVSRQIIATLIASVVVGLAAFTPLSPIPARVRSAFAFLAILPLLWAALRLGLRDTATNALIISCLAIWGVVAHSSPFNQGTLNDSLLSLVAFIVAATLPSLALAADRRETQTTLSRTRQELVQSQKLEALGQLTGGVAHDFNNVLAAVAGGLRLLDRQDAERAKTLAAISQTLERGGALTKQLLAFARREPLKPEVVDLSEVMQGVETLIGQSLGNSVVTRVLVDEGIWPVEVERAQLELAILNLALNARDAMPDGGELTITVENLTTSKSPEIAIRVSDTGTGMNADVLARAFEPFFSTKPAGQGTGLGLAQVYNFAKHSGGHASVESSPGAGAAITIILPKA